MTAHRDPGPGGIRPATGNLLEADAEALVNTVNTVGVMGKGIALQFKRAFPENFREYAAACRRHDLDVGQVLTHEVRGSIGGPKYVFNLPTKRHWRSTSQLEWIETGLAALAGEIRRLGVKSVAVPPLGCGNGGLDWSDVRPLIARAFESLPGVEVLLFEPGHTPAAAAMPVRTAVPKMTRGRALVVGLMHRYLASLMDVTVTLLELHKLVYFLQEAGEPMKFRFLKGTYGPYADNLRHVLGAMEGHFVTGFGDGGEQPGKELDVKHAAVLKAERFVVARPDVQAHFERVDRLIAGFEDPFGMELLASVHWVATHHGAATADAATEAVHDWNARKRQLFAASHVSAAWNRLQSQGWLPAA